MGVPWFRILKAVLGVADLALIRGAARTDFLETRRRSGGLGRFETRMAGFMIGALKEAFDRDSRRLAFEREQADAARQRAERALRLDLLARACERELGRLRLVSAVCAASWIGSLLVTSAVLGGSLASRVALGCGWATLLAGLATSFGGQSAVGRALADLERAVDLGAQPVGPTLAGAIASWLTIAGLALTGLAVLLL